MYLEWVCNEECKSFCRNHRVSLARGFPPDSQSRFWAAIGELNNTPELLATTDTVIEEVADGAVRYAGSVAKLLPEE